MDAIQAILSRRSIRRFKSMPVPKDALYSLIELALRAPNAGNLQDFQFIICTDRKIIMGLPELCMDQAWMTSAPAVIVVCSRPDIQKKWYGEAGDMLARQNAAAAAQNIIIGATAMGLATCWVSGFNQEGVEDHFDVSGSGARVECIIPVGFAGEEPDKRTEPTLQSHLFFDTYGMDIQDWDAFNKDFGTKIAKRFEVVQEKKEGVKEKAKGAFTLLAAKAKEHYVKIKDKSKKAQEQDDSEENTEE